MSTADRKPRNRHCMCSRADSMNGRAREDCPLHGNTEIARAYRAGLWDGNNGYPPAEMGKRIVSKEWPHDRAAGVGTKDGDDDE